ncbi:ubiquitin carboxyl-terminal hydrolase 2 isoform X2 [Jatropha curcas]|uniref:ubiquitin carboxyl-terminal hydrolase 2 isoform X2 n=1 Tax=Jatropha curcas TaxID=180498 RepID=UPI0005FBCDF5|nr:ubiquitin carboxyl-terminal hydrolase 2 isoform X2 [Jatropha curcas]
MGKRVKKKSRSLQKEKRITPHSPKIAPLQSNPGDNISDEGVAALKERKSCAHLDKGFNLNNLSEKFGSSNPLRCEDCREGVADRRGAKGKGKHGKKKGSADPKSESKAIWVCLECGHYACGGVGLPTSPQSHALRHNRQTRHPLVMQWENPHLRWCFLCNTLIPVETMEESGEKKDALLDVVKLMKTRSSERSSVDVEDVWFGGGSVASEIKAEGTVSNSLEGRGGYIVRGLVNLGNTCFFNSVMQNLLSMDKLRDFFFDQDASFGPLTIALKKLFAETKPETGLKSVINPRSFFGCICSKAPQFRGYQQQDSHELLRCLLDGLSSEELGVRKQINASKEDGISLKHGSTFVDALFGGRISSTVSCIECGHSSTVYEPFLDLSLPVPTKKPPTKRAQLVARPKKTKLPPKRGGKIRGKANKDIDSVPAQSISNPTASKESPCQTLSMVAQAEKAVASSGDAAGSNSVCLTSMDDKGSLVSQKISTAPDADNDQVVEAKVEQTAASFDNFTWMDYLGQETIADDPYLTSQKNDVSTSQYSKNMIPNDGLMESSHVFSVDGEPTPKLDSSSVNPWEEEVPLQVTSSEVLLLPCKEESFTNGEIIRGEAGPSSSVVGGQDEADFDGFGDLFNEPEVSSGPVAGPSLDNETARTGFTAGNSSDSDPDEVDNSDSPVSIESCLAHFIKPELLSNDNAWECENCSKTLPRRRLETKKKQSKTALETMINGGESLNNGKIVCSSQNCIKAETSQTDELKLSVSQSEQKGDMTVAHAEQSRSSTLYESCSQESISSAVDSSTVDEPSSTGYTTAKDQLDDSQLSGNCDAEEDEDKERTSKKVKVKRDATKRVLVDKAPPVLTIHLKRFSQDARGRLSKLNGHVNFGEILDLRPYLDPRCVDREKYMYRLVGVVEHLGTMIGGHYVAYVRGGVRSKGKEENENGDSVWYHASDAYVREVSLEEVLRCEAYILFYEKI